MKRCLFLLALALLPACSRQPDPAPTATVPARFDAPAPVTPPRTNPGTSEATAPASLPAPAADTPASASAPEASVPAPPPAAAPAPDAVLRDWGRAIEAGDWARVRGLWGHGGADSGVPAADFARRWGRLGPVRVTIGAGQQEGAAGSSYYTAPVRVEAGARTLAGAVTLRRVNDVPGASAEQLRWHLDQSTRAPWTDPR
jgi:hypothetical protein